MSVPDRYLVSFKILLFVCFDFCLFVAFNLFFALSIFALFLCPVLPPLSTHPFSAPLCRLTWPSSLLRLPTAVLPDFPDPDTLEYMASILDVR